MENKNLLNYFSNQVNLYLDNRLNEDSEQNLLDAINNDSTCNQVYHEEKKFRDLIKTRVKRSSVSSDLIQSIKSKLD